MDDRQLQRLLMMAGEAEQLTSPLTTRPAAGRDSPAGRGAAGSRALTGTDVSERPVLVVRRERSWWRSGGVLLAGALAAACVAIGVFMNLPPSAAPPIGRGGRAELNAEAFAVPGNDALPGEVPAETVLAKHQPEDEEAVLFAVYSGADGSCECVQVNEPDWGGEKRLADVSRHELLRAGLQDPCMTVAPEVVVIGVAGKRGTVPTSRHHAESLARNLSGQSFRGRDVASAAYAAMPELPAGTVVVAERLSIRP